MPAEPHLLMCEVTDLHGNVDSEPLVFSIDEHGWTRLEFERGVVWRVPPEFRQLVAEGRGEQAA